MSKLNFLLPHTLLFQSTEISYDPVLGSPKDLVQHYKDPSKNQNLLFRLLETPLYFLLSTINYYLVDGFIESVIGNYIRRYHEKGKVFLEAGCGDFSLHKFVDKSDYYNAFDISFTNYYLRQILKNKSRKTNLSIASLLQIPLSNRSVDTLVCSEVLYEVPNVDKALSEISRTLKRNGLFIVSNSNSYAYKYIQRGDHPKARNKWKYKEFSKVCQKFGFELVESMQKGYYLHLPSRIIGLSFQLPITSIEESKNTNFFYVFRKIT